MYNVTWGVMRMRTAEGRGKVKKRNEGRSGGGGIDGGVGEGQWVK